MRLLLLFILSITLSAAIGQSKQVPNMNTVFLEQLMQTKPDQFGEVLKHRKDWIVQIKYTQIDRDRKNRPQFTEYSFNLQPDQYFYPASTVKMPLAFLALEKINELNIPGVDLHTTLITDSADRLKYIGKVSDDSQERPCIALFIRKIFLVSDNDAYNRLYEFLGQEYIQQKLTEKGYPDAVIRHWLSVSRTEIQNRTTHPVYFLDRNGQILHEQPSLKSNTVFPSFECKLGKGYISGNTLIQEPFSFSEKNRVYLNDLHSMLQSVLFPETFPEKSRFKLTKNDYDFLYTAMSCFPPESKYPAYPKEEVWDASVKFLLYGAAKGDRPKHIRIFNKIGGAYGFLTDIAYIVDFKNKVEFILSATIHCNSDGIFNDDRYDYDTIGYPFLRDLGQLMYEHELKRKKKRLPILTPFILGY